MNGVQKFSNLQKHSITLSHALILLEVTLDNVIYQVIVYASSISLQ